MIKGTVNILGWGIFAHVTLSETVSCIHLSPPHFSIFQVLYTNMAVSAAILINPLFRFPSESCFFDLMTASITMITSTKKVVVSRVFMKSSSSSRKENRRIL